MLSNNEYLAQLIKSSESSFNAVCVDALEKHLQRKSTIEDYKECTLVWNSNNCYNSFDTTEVLLYYKTVCIGRAVETVYNYFDLEKITHKIETDLRFIPAK